MRVGGKNEGEIGFFQRLLCVFGVETSGYAEVFQEVETAESPGGGAVAAVVGDQQVEFARGEQVVRGGGVFQPLQRPLQRA